ncbi:anoctamin-9 [Oryzias melastigma]|uniref:anoctamin-9 n=1 Tax=Oryzias melastigma TaxID=30732 RepID=UPI00168D49D6|nr:anoctamin-9 [Oryzias melastigma]
MMFTFQFFTLFSSLFYVAFFLGRNNGYPGNYARTAGQRLDECHPSGCLTDLFIQMLVIMVLKQVFSSITEITKPRLQMRWRKITTTKGLSADDSSKNLIVSCAEFLFRCLEKRGRKTDTPDSKDEHQHCWKEKCDECLLNDWQKNYQLADSDDLSLFYVMLKMGKSTKVH